MRFAASVGIALRHLPSTSVATARVYARCRHQAFTAERLHAIVEVVCRLAPTDQRFVVLGDGEWSDALTPLEFMPFVDDVASWPVNGTFIFATGFGADDVSCHYAASSTYLPDEAAAIEVTFPAARLFNDLDGCAGWFAALAQAVPHASSGTLALSMRVTAETLPALYENPGLDVSDTYSVRENLCGEVERAAGVAFCTFLSSSLTDRCLHGFAHAALTQTSLGNGTMLRAPASALLAHDEASAAPLLALGAALFSNDALHAHHRSRYGTWVLHGSNVVEAEHAAVQRYHQRFASREHLERFTDDVAAAHARRESWLRQRSAPKRSVDEPEF